MLRHSVVGIIAGVLTVFLSSAFIELEDYRTSAFEAIDGFGHKCVRMETFPAAARDIPDFCREKVAESDVIILLLGTLYGTPIPNREISYTEDEFETAIALKKPILVFEPAPAANTNLKAALAAIEQNGLTYEKQRERQKAFGRRARQGRLPRLFKDVADLKFQVVYSLSELASPITSTSHAGERLPHLCNRTLQIEEFGDSFRTALAGAPQVYVVHGHEKEQHRQCVERLVCLHITYPKRASPMALVGPAAERAIVEWPIERDSDDILFNRLCRRLFLAIDPEYTFPDGYGPEAFCTLAIAAGLPHLRFRHIIRQERWNEAMQSLCRSRYLPFWRNVATTFNSKFADKKAPRLLIFFEMKHRFEDDEAARTFGDGLATFFTATGRETGVVCRVLRELERVTLDDLDTWHERFGERLLPVFQGKTASELFPQPPLHMIEVETRIRQLAGVEDYGK